MPLASGSTRSAYAPAPAQLHASPPGKEKPGKKKDIELERKRLCKLGQGNADLFRETLVYTKPEDLQSDGLIQASHAHPLYSPRASIHSLDALISAGLLPEVPRRAEGHRL